MADMMDKDERHRRPFRRTPTDFQDPDLPASVDKIQPESMAQASQSDGTLSSDRYKTKSSGASSDSVHDVPTTPSNDENPPAPFKALFSFTTRRNLRIMVPGILLSILSGLLKPMLSVILGLVFDVIAAYMDGRIDGPELMRQVSQWCLILTGIGVGNWLTNGFMFASWVSFGESQAKEVRGRMFKGLLRREMEWFDTVKDGIGSLLVRVQTQIRDLQLATSQPLGFALNDIVACLGSIGVALYFSWKLTLVLSCVIPVTVVVIGFISRSLQPAVEAQKACMGASTKITNTAINAVDTVKVYNAQADEVRKYEKSVLVAAKPYYTQANSNAKQMGAGRAIVNTTFVTGFWYGLALYNNGEVTAGNVLTCLYAFMQASQSANSIFPKVLVLTKGMSSGQAIQGYIGDIEKKNDNQSKIMLGCTWPQKRCEGDVEMRDVTFAYPSNPDQPVLKHASFSFPAGETTFLFGRSGSGKSTISNLLLKFYEPSTGEITIDGQRIERLDTRWVRENITLVQQESVLFNGTIEENLQFGSKDGILPDAHEIKQACDLAMLTPVIADMPLGLKTPINAGRDTMSGGQKQRVAIARARLRDTPILILDEVTSALDLANKALVWEAIRYWRKGKTTIVITHDEQQIMDDDFVYILRNGEIVEEGFRKMLVTSPDGIFAALVSEVEDEEESPLSPITEGSHDRFSALEPTATPRTSIYKTAAPSIAESVESYNTETRPDTRPSTAVVDNVKWFFSQTPERRSYSMDTYTNRGSMVGGPSLLWANQMHMENMTRRPPPLRVRAVDGPASPPIPQRNTLRHADLGRIRSRPPISRQNSSAGMRSLRPLSHYEEEPELFEVIERGHPAEFPKMMLRRTSVKLSENNRNKPNHGAKGPRLLKPKSKQGDEEQHSIECKRLSKLRLRRKGKNKSKATQEGEPATLVQILSTVWPSLSVRGKILLPLTFLVAFLASAITPAFSFIIAKLLETFYVPKENQQKEALKWALVALGLAMLDGITAYFAHYFFEVCGRLWVDELRIKAMRNVLSQPREWFDDPANSPAQLSQILDRSAEEMRNLLGRFVHYSFAAVCMIVISVVWAMIVCWKLTVVGLATIPPIYGLTRLFDLVSNRWEKKTDVQMRVIGETLTETFMNIRIVRALTLESRFEKKHTAALEQSYQIGLKRGLYSGILYGLSDATAMFSGSLFFYYGAVLIGTGAYDFGGVMAAMTLLIFGMGSATAALAFMPQIAASRVTATQVLDLVNLPPQANETALLKADDSTLDFEGIANPLPIVMKNLNFAYPLRSDVAVLQNLTLKFEAHQFTALVGSSGSGKSTIAAILLALYSPAPRQARESYLSTNDRDAPLTFGGVSSAKLNLPALRSHMALVSQFPTIFPSTVAQNITYGLPPSSPLCTPGNIEAAAKAAGIHEFILSLTSGYQTLIGESGQGLSGGQMMRVAIVEH